MVSLKIYLCYLKIFNGKLWEIPLLCKKYEHIEKMHCKKRLAISPSQAGMSLTKLFTDRESLVSDIPAGDRKIANLFLQCAVVSAEV
jgi:hypothetical protein